VAADAANDAATSAAAAASTDAAAATDAAAHVTTDTVTLNTEWACRGSPGPPSGSVPLPDSEVATVLVLPHADSDATPGRIETATHANANGAAA
jgi:hypothetical protein